MSSPSRRRKGIPITRKSLKKMVAEGYRIDPHLLTTQKARDFYKELREDDDLNRLLSGKRILRSLNEPTAAQRHLESSEELKLRAVEQARLDAVKARANVPAEVRKTLPPLPPIRRRRLKR
jgi:hypothetical protein